MRSAGLSVIPGSDVAIAKLADASALAREYGYPVILKAAAEAAVAG